MSLDRHGILYPEVELVSIAYANTITVRFVYEWLVMDNIRLRDIRLLRGHTQESLAEVLNTNARQVWRWESGETTPSADNVAMIAMALNTSADYLLGLDDDPTPYRERNENLGSLEQAVVSALRRGDTVAAIRAIVGA